MSDQEIHPAFRSFDSRLVIKDAAFTGKVLSNGADTIMEEVTVAGVACAGKRIYDELQSQQQLIKAFMKECSLLSTIKHPNIVTFVGLWYPPHYPLPLLVMEKLDQDLDHFLDYTPNIPLPVKVSILEDVARGLLYLHTQVPPIIHCDLEARNVLLTSSLLAKIGDFGSAYIMDPQNDDTQRQDACPGVLYYMPPEAFRPVDDPRYDISLDVFSFGVLGLFVGTHHKPPKDILPGIYLGNKGLLLGRTEVERRRKYFDHLEGVLPGGDQHPLVPLLKQCLSNNPSQRPTAGEVLTSLTKMTEEYHVQACQQAIKENGSLDQTVMQAVFFGPPRSGKSSLKDRLVGKKPQAQRASTGVAEKVVQVRIGKSTVQVSGTVWNEIEGVHDATFMAVTEISNSLSSTQMSGDPSGSVKSQQPAAPSASPFPESPDSKAKEFSPTTTDVNPVADIQSSLQKKSILKAELLRSLHEPWTLYMTDAGGQPEFQELLPVLVSGPTIFFLVFPLNKDLNQKCVIEYLDPRSGKSTVPFEASFTMMESLLQSLASIVSTQRIKHLQSGKSFLPKAVFVGTHKDKVTPEQLLKIDAALQAKVKKTDAFKEDIVEFASETRMILAVNNLSESDEDVDEVRTVVHLIGTRSDNYRVPTPYPWLILGINLNLSQSSVLTYDECFQLAKECGIKSEKELNKALWFLHNYTGTVRHFKGISDLKDVVIKDPQYIFDKVTEMIVNTFTFEHTGIHTYEDFVKKGMFPLETFERLSSKSDVLSPQKLISLLEHLHIIAPVAEEGAVKKYFLPCALTHATLPPHQATANPIVPSLYITFNSGYCPKGLFGSLVARLMHMPLGPDKLSDFEDWELEEDQIYRNQVSFSVGPFNDLFRFVFNPSYIRIDLTSSPDEDRDIPLGNVCCDVRECIQESVEQLTKALNYSTARTVYSIAFACPGMPSCSKNGEPHTAKVKFHKGKPKNMTCTEKGKNFNLLDDSMCWFNKDAQCPTTQPTSAAALCPSLQSRDESQPPCLADAFEELLPLASEWQNIGVLLGITLGELQRIKSDNHHQCRDCLREMIGMWLNQVNPLPTWSALHKAVKLTHQPQ